LEAAHTDL
jgi:hypothetical protein